MLIGYEISPLDKDRVSFKAPYRQLLFILFYYFLFLKIDFIWPTWTWCNIHSYIIIIIIKNCDITWMSAVARPLSSYRVLCLLPRGVPDVTHCKRFFYFYFQPWILRQTKKKLWYPNNWQMRNLSLSEITMATNLEFARLIFKRSRE